MDRLLHQAMNSVSAIRTRFGTLLMGTALAGLFLFLPTVAHADTFTVNTILDNTTDQCATPGAPCSLRGAVIKANATPGWDTIEVPAGTYRLTIPGANENDSMTGDLDILDDVTIVGLTLNPNDTIIQSGSTDNSSSGIDKVMSINPKWDRVISATINNVTIRYGKNTSLRAGDGLGGGLDYEATDSVHNGTAGGTLMIDNCIVTGNSTATGDGGGIQVNNGTNAKSGKVIITSSVIEGNSAADGMGGGIYVNGNPFEIRNTTIRNNTATATSDLTYGKGGGIGGYGQSGITNLIEASTISGNTVNGIGAPQGAGIYVVNSPTNVINTTVSGNTGAAEGGGIWSNYAALRNTTVTLNTATTGGGLFYLNNGTGSMYVYNSIFSGNTAPTEPDLHGAFTAGSNNLIGGDAKLGPLADNGGKVRTHALLSGSPAIDTGSNAELFPPGSYDARGPGFSRKVDGNFDGTAVADMGAFEYVAPDLTISIVPPVTFYQGQTGAQYTIRVSNLTTGVTNGVVSVAITIPLGSGGFTSPNLSGTGWSCNNGTLTCSRSDVNAGGYYPDILLVANVSPTAASSVTNHAVVSGGDDGNSANNTADATTTVTQTTATTVGAVTANYGDTVSLSATVSPKAAGTMTFSVSGVGVVGSAQVDTATGVATASYIVSAGAGAPTLTAAFAPTDTAAYKPSSGSSTLTVNKAPLTVTVDDKNRTYGAANPPFTVKYSGFVLGQTASNLNGTLVLTTTATTTSGVGTYPINAGGLTSANYTITHVNGTLTVDNAPLVVKTNDASKTYGDINPAFAAGYTGLVAGDTTSVVTGTVSFTTTATQSSPVSTYSVTPSGLTAANYTITYTAGTLTVGKAPLTITAANADKIYGDANPAFAATASGFVLGETEAVLGGTTTFNTPATVSSPVGGYQLTPGGRTAGNYAITYVDGTFTVTKAPLTVKANDDTRHYGYADPAFTATYSGLKAGDTQASLGGTIAFTTSALSYSSPGTYTITPAGLTLSNYTITYADGTLTVDKAPLTITTDSASKTYGDTNPVFAVSYSGFVLGHNASALSGVLSFATTADQNSSVGTYPVTPSGLSHPYYAISYVDGTLTVNKAPLQVKGFDRSKIYGDDNPTFAVSYTGFVLSETEAVLGGTVGYATAATQSSGAGAYAITASGLTASNYAFSYVDGTLTVNKAPLTITAVSTSRLYGAANPVFSAAYTGFVLGQTPAALGGTLGFTTADLSSPVGAYPITPGGLTSANYAITYVGGTLTVDKAPLTVTTDDATKAYGAANPAFTVSYSGFVLGETKAVLGGSPTFATVADLNSAPGAYTVTPAGLTSGNYAIAYADGTLTVSKAPLTVTAKPAAKTYGDANPAFAVTYAGLVLGQTEAVLGGTVTFATPATQSSPVGSYAVTPGGLTSDNYAITYVDGALSVDKAPLKISADAVAKTYGDVNPSFTATYDGFKLSEDKAVLGGALDFGTAATPSSGVGGYTVTPSGLTAANYAITYVDGTLTVNKAPLKVTADDQSRLYGAVDPVFAVSYDGFVLGQSEAVLGGTLSFTAGTATSPAGIYPITPSGLTAANYAISYVNGTLTVAKAPLTVTAAAAARPYGAANPTFAVTYSGFVLGETKAVLGGTLGFTTPAVAGSAPGAYAVTPGGLTSPNYVVSYVDGTLTVTKAALTVKADDKLKGYGAAIPAFTVTYTGLVLGEAPAVLGGTLSVNTPATQASPVGAYTITPSGLTSSNYAITFVDGTLTIAKITVTVRADDQSRIYGEPNPPFTATYSGFLPGDTPAVLNGTIGFATPATTLSPVGAYTITPSGLSSANYEIQFVPGKLTVRKRLLSINVYDESRYYGDPDPSFGGTHTGDLPADALKIDYDTVASRLNDVGRYRITARISDPNNRLGNYDLQTSDGHLTVRPTPLTIAAQNATRRYGEANPALTAAFAGLRNGDLVAVTLATVAMPSSPVGTYSVQVTVADAAQARNYAVTLISGSLQVTPVQLAVTPASAVRLVGEPNPSLTGEIVGVRTGDAITASYDTSATRESVPGAYPIKATLHDPQGKLSNYAVTLREGVLTVQACDTVRDSGRPVTRNSCRTSRQVEEQVLQAMGRRLDTPTFLVRATAATAQDAIDHASGQVPRLVLSVGDHAGLTGAILDRDAMRALAKAGGEVLVESPYGSLLLPAKVLAQFAAGASDEPLVILFEQAAGTPAPNGAGFKAITPVVSVTISTLHADQSITRHERFDARLTLTMKLAAEGDMDLAGIYRVNADGSVTYVGGQVNPASHTISAPRDGLSNYVVLLLDREYSDVSADHWAHGAIKAMTARHVVKGAGDGTFDPDRAVTRAEFATMVARAFGLLIPGTPSRTFADVASDAWYASVMSAVVDAGLFDPEAANMLRPTLAITREEMAVVMARAMTKFNPGRPLPTPNVEQTLARFKDQAQASATTRVALAQLVEAGLLRGRAADELAPKGTVTRAEAATLIKRLLDWAAQGS